MDVKGWIKNEIAKGEDPEVIKGALEILGFDPKIAEQIFQEVKKEEKKKIKATKKQMKSKEENQTVGQQQEIVKESGLKEEPVEVLEWNVPRELLQHHENHEKKIKEIKKYAIYLIIFLGISLILLGAYLFYFIRR